MAIIYCLSLENLRFGLLNLISNEQAAMGITIIIIIHRLIAPNATREVLIEFAQPCALMCNVSVMILFLDAKINDN